MDSADAGFFLRGMFFIEYLFLPGGLPQELPFRVFPDFEDHRVEAIDVVRMKENFLRFLEADSAPWIPPKTRALPLIEVESHYGITVIP
jgi:hypothetical protein